MTKGLSFRISGDLGDLCYQCAILAALPGPHTLLCVDRPGLTAQFTPRVPLLKPMLLAQAYIGSVECSEDKPDIDLTGFRRFHSATTTLIAANAAECGMQMMLESPPDGSAPWLTAQPNQSFAGKIIIARSPRYNNLWFPWRQIVEHYGHRLLFVGLPDEHRAFIAAFGHVTHLQIKDYLELAQTIAGAGLFIGNQSSPHAVAMGLGVTIIQETCLQQPDCIFRRDNVQYVTDGACHLPDIAGSGSLEIGSTYVAQDNGNRSIVPPGLWQYPGLPPSTHFSIQVELVKTLEKCSAADADNLLYAHNAQRHPEFFANTTNDPFLMSKIAYNNTFGAPKPSTQP